MKNILKLISLVAVFSMVLVGCGSGDDDGDDKVVFNHYQTSEAKTLDSNLSTDAVSGQITYNSTERLVKVTADGEVLPGVATDWEVSDDGLTVTFNLRDDSMWVDNKGEEYRAVTAEDFVSAIEFMQLKEEVDGEEEYASQNAAYVTKYIEVVEAVAVDDTTFEITLAKPEEYVIPLFSHYALAPRPADFIEELGGDDKYGLGADSVLNNGAFYISSYEATTNVKLTKNETYWNVDEVELDEVNIRVFNSPENNTLVSEYEANNLDAMVLSGENVAKYASEDDIKLFSETVVFNTVINQDTSRDTDVKYFAEHLEGRMALAQAFDPNYAVESIIGSGYASPYWVPKGFDFSEDSGNDFRTDTGYEDGYFEYDVEAAQANWETFKEKTGKDEFTLEILNYDSENSRLTMEYVQQELEKNLEGLTINIKPVAFQDKLQLGTDGDFDLNYYGWSPDYPNAKGMLTNYESTSPYNEIKWENEEYDKLLEAGDRESLIEAEKILMEDGTMLPGFQRVRVARVNPDFEGFELLPFGGDYDYSVITTK